MLKRILHILPNAHLDPVWLWDWQEGLNEGIATCRSMLNLMDEFAELTFMRGESSIYEHLAKYDPATFARIGRMVEAGRWDLVGGNYVQSDTNVPDTMTFLRQYETGRGYFKKHFQTEIQAAWAADSFGHSAGFPDIYQAAGFRYFAFCRPAEHLVHLDKPLFFWNGAGGGRILCWRCPVGWYGTERFAMTARLDEVLAAPDYGLENHAVFVGLGNHGGGTSRQQILDLLAWREAHPEVEVRFSTLHGFFAACEREIAARGEQIAAEFSGELNFCLRGCHTSAAKIKSRFRNAEAMMKSEAFAAAMIAPLVKTTPPTLEQDWKGLLFNTFHDILPGTSIERACRQQIEWLDGVLHNGRAARFDLLNRLNAAVAIRLPEVVGDAPQAVPHLLFNPRPVAWRGLVEVEACLDYRPRFDYEGRPNEVPFQVYDHANHPVAFQEIATEMECMPDVPWRKRVLVEMELPPGGWKSVKIGFCEGAERKAFAGNAVKVLDDHTIANEFYRVSAAPGARTLKITRPDGTPVLAADGVEFAVYEDLFGSWGDMTEGAEGYHCPHRLETWRVENVKVLESGPMRASLFVRFSGTRSNLNLTVQLAAGRDAVDLSGRLLWQDRGARLRLVADRVDAATYAVPGGVVRRAVTGDVPSGRWMVLEQACGRTTAVATDVLTACTALEREFCVNIVRGSRYASDVPATGAEYPERSINDLGEHLFRMALSADAARAQTLADELELPPVGIMSYAHDGVLGEVGETLQIEPADVRLFDLTCSEGQCKAWLQSPSTQSVTLRWGGRIVATEQLTAWKLIPVQFSVK